MSRASLSSFLRRGGALLVLGAAGLGCGGIGPGDYVFFRVAFSDQLKKSSGCYGDTGIPADEKSDKTTFRKSGLFLIYGSAEEGEDKLFLDSGEAALEGIEEGGIYTFTGTATDVDYTEPDGAGDKHTTTNKVELEFTIDGTSLYGSGVTTVKSSCSGSTCDLTLPIPISCTTTQTFVGTEVEDVELQHDIK